MAESEPSSTNPTPPSESEENIAHVSFVSYDFPSQGGIPSMVPLPSIEVYSFDLNSLVEPHLHSYVSFWIAVEALYSTTHWTIIDEGESISILSSMAWQALVYPNLNPTSSQVLTFNRRIREPLGFLPNILIT